MPYKDSEKQKEAQHRHYKNNKNDYVNRMNNRRLAYRAYILEYLKEHPCVDCGEDDPIVLEFDHRDQSQKSYKISGYNSHRISIEKLKIEIEKCDVRCANCHRRRTYVQLSWFTKTPA